MRALTLDFRRPYRSRALGFVLMIAGTAGSAVVGIEYQSVAHQIEAVQASIREQGATSRRRGRVSSIDGDDQKIAQELKSAREIIRQLGMPWNELFASFEAADAPTVALLGIESDTEKQRIKINAEAKNLDAMLNYLRALEGRSTLADVYLQSHQIQQQDPQQPVRFVLSATWLVRR